MGAPDDTGNPDSWADAVRVVGDPWVVAAARSGDGRAMRCLAHRAWHRRAGCWRCSAASCRHGTSPTGETSS